jgi:hypothetical protein
MFHFKDMHKNDALPSVAEENSDRRIGNRTTSIYRPALIETEDFAGFCLIRNISPGGVMGSVYADFAAEQPVRVQFHPEYTITGAIAWSKDKRIGIRFDAEIDVDQVLRDLGSREIGGKVNRAPRLPVHCQGEVVIEKQVLPMTLQDISQRGIKASLSSIRLGDEVVVRLDGLEPRKAIVRWRQDEAAGLNFIMPLGFEQLAEWVIRQQSK